MNLPMSSFNIAINLFYFQTLRTFSRFKNNIIVILTGLSASSHVASSDTNSEPGWWEGMVGKGKAFDTSKYYVICINSLGSCFGSTGPASVNEITGEPYRLTFPELTIDDMAVATKLLFAFFPGGLLNPQTPPQKGLRPGQKITKNQAEKSQLLAVFFKHIAILLYFSRIPQVAGIFPIDSWCFFSPGRRPGRAGGPGGRRAGPAGRPGVPRGRGGLRGGGARAVRRAAGRAAAPRGGEWPSWRAATSSAWSVCNSFLCKASVCWAADAAASRALDTASSRSFTNLSRCCRSTCSAS